MCRRKQQKTISAKINKIKYRCQNSSNLRSSNLRSSNLRTGKIIKEASGKHNIKRQHSLRRIETIAERDVIEEPTALHHIVSF